MSKMNIAERRLPQDGRIKLGISSREIDLRVSTLPTLYRRECCNEDTGLGNVLTSLEELGFPEAALSQFKNASSYLTE